IRMHVIDKLDHKNINLEVEFMQGKLASTENLAVGIWHELEPFIHELDTELHCVKVVESENNHVEFYGN
ncbi:MAG TPA: 6-carboxytetrahydropterin synthase, partial [Bacteroidetes bacterium]|nr:6-carboxytetrahydropterin synthase [Bacteroidota bacterium]